ncbi:endonuclease NucS [Porticoccus sp. W117]|uniref:endonuclease NucS domain-containing protein n=1 Tax=Porticoccus sp. W117 TaxID=3054777 RepID=UPI0025922C32|nr:endonuclease NucS domain-containing protein [Porticoccus sp. W117]MDM3871376.1 endonuclease NucS [Porticoccus sp. W117]
MAVQHGIWKIGSKPQALKPIQLDSEELLEQQIFEDVSILNESWLLIGRQVYTDFGKYIDLLAIDAFGSIIVIELKKHKTPRDVVAQTIDYAAWVEGLPTERIAQIYQDFAEQFQLAIKDFDEAFQAKFGSKPVEDEVNSSHQMVVVAAELDASTERIINYLNDKASVAVNAVFFSAFEDGDNQYLSRSWMIDPGETEDHAINVGQKNEWNGEYYASFGVFEDGRSWEDARKHGFISAGGGRWYSKTLFKLNLGDRVWVNIPKTGYVGVGEVISKAIVADDFITPDMELSGNYKSAADYGEDNAEYFVQVRWIKDFSPRDAVNEVGLFGNQNSVAQPRTSKWDHTIERLQTIWGVK